MVTVQAMYQITSQISITSQNLHSKFQQTPKTIKSQIRTVLRDNLHLKYHICSRSYVTQDIKHKKIPPYAGIKSESADKVTLKDLKNQDLSNVCRYQKTMTDKNSHCNKMNPMIVRQDQRCSIHQIRSNSCNQFIPVFYII